MYNLGLLTVAILLGLLFTSWALSMTTSGREQYDQYLTKPVEAEGGGGEFTPSGDPIDTTQLGLLRGRTKLTKAGQVVTVNNDWDALPLQHFAYASDNVVTVSGIDATDYFQVGSKLRVAQGSTKYFYVTKVSATQLKVTGGGQYTYTSEAVTSLELAASQYPLDFPAYFTYSPVVTFSGHNGAVANRYTELFSIEGARCTVKIFHRYTYNAGTAPSWQVALPFGVSSALNQMYVFSETINAGIATLATTYLDTTNDRFQFNYGTWGTNDTYYMIDTTFYFVAD